MLRHWTVELICTDSFSVRSSWLLVLVPGLDLRPKIQVPLTPEKACLYIMVDQDLRKLVFVLGTMLEFIASEAKKQKKWHSTIFKPWVMSSSSSSSSLSVSFAQTVQWDASMNGHVSCRSSRIPHSLSWRLLPLGQVSSRRRWGQICRMCSCVWGAVPHAHCAVSILCMWALSRQCFVLRRKIVVYCFLFKLLMGSSAGLLLVCSLHDLLYFSFMRALISDWVMGWEFCFPCVP